MSCFQPAQQPAVTPFLPLNTRGTWGVSVACAWLMGNQSMEVADPVPCLGCDCPVDVIRRDVRADRPGVVRWSLWGKVQGDCGCRVGKGQIYGFLFFFFLSLSLYRSIHFGGLVFERAERREEERRGERRWQCHKRTTVDSRGDFPVGRSVSQSIYRPRQRLAAAAVLLIGDVLALRLASLYRHCHPRHPLSGLVTGPG